MLSAAAISCYRMTFFKGKILSENGGVAILVKSFFTSMIYSKIRQLFIMRSRYLMTRRFMVMLPGQQYLIQALCFIQLLKKILTHSSLQIQIPASGFPITKRTCKEWMKRQYSPKLMSITP